MKQASNATYFIGGIATDIQLYEHQLQHIPNSIYLPFPKHDIGDTMETYVLKFLPLIDSTMPFNMVGCSMGGIMTMELLKHIHPEKVILISSVKCRKEMPWQLRQLNTLSFIIYSPAICLLKVPFSEVVLLKN